MYRRILVPVDGSEASLRGLDEALTLGRALHAKIKIVHMVNELILDASYAPSMDYGVVITSLREAGRKVIDAAVATAQESGAVVESEMLEHIGGRAAGMIVKAAAEWSADLIVMGTHGRRGLRRLALGSDAELVLRSAPVPVLMVRSVPAG